MSKHILVFMDGTWNDPTERTNVYKLFGMLDGVHKKVHAEEPLRDYEHILSNEHEAFYLEGVGADGRHQSVLGGSLGVGLHERVIDAFILVSRVYRPGDKIWVFGFSRGAWSARSLAGLIGRAGLLAPLEAMPPEAHETAEKLWLDCKRRQSMARGDAFWAQHDPCPIKMVGVWDTVGALGIPVFNGIKTFDRLEKSLFDFADLSLSPRVEHGRQALAIDETRVDFTPTLWEPRDGVHQVWFSGVHADVGGGYPSTGLSDITLQWMVDEVNAVHGQAMLNPASLPDPLQGDPIALRHDESRKTIWKLRPREPRQISPDAALHPTVLERLRQRLDYRPRALAALSTLEAYFHGSPSVEEALQAQQDLPPARHLDANANGLHAVVFSQKWWNATRVQVFKGETYSITATGEYLDKSTCCSADGYESPNRLMRWMESARRVEQAPWFALIAAVHADADLEARNPDAANMLTGAFESGTHRVGAIDDASQLVRVGRQGQITADRDGYLYLFANDAAFAYSNNSLSVTATLQRRS
jgi:uncharacterized protein (DUF2235 family)